MLNYDPFSVEAMENPDQFFPELLADHPFYRLEQYNGWAISRFEHCWKILQERTAFSIVEGPVFPKTVGQCPFNRSEIKASLPDRSFSAWDAPAHPEIRKAMSSSFAPVPVAGMEKAMRAMCRDRLEAQFDSGEMDIVGDYAGLIVLPNICFRLGVPCDDPKSLFGRIQRATKRTQGKAGFTETGLEISADIGRQLAKSVASRRIEREKSVQDNGTTLDSLLEYNYRDENTETRLLTDEEIATHLRTLLIGGAETVPKVLAAGILQLHRQPEQLKALRENASLGRAAFEEMMRFGGVLQHVGRTAMVDYEIDGQNIKVGERVFLLIQAANRDEREFDVASHFNILRKTRRSLALGTGRHHCIGAHLARLEGRVLLEEFVRMIPKYHIDESALSRQPSEFQAGYTAMPIQF